MTDATNNPPEWAVRRACEIVKPNPEAALAKFAQTKTEPERFAGSDLERVARYVAEHEEPPVDPDLLIAREACARYHGRYAASDALPRSYRLGCFDTDDDAMQCALLALQLKAEGWTPA